MRKGTKKITSGTKEWASYNVNCVDGCYNDCRYCYAKKMAIRFGRHTHKTWKHMKVNIKSVEKNYTFKNGRVMFPSSHDIFDIPEIKEACFTTLLKLLQVGNEVLITTKPRLAVVQEIIGKTNRYKEQIQFRFTITSLDNSLLIFWEPNAPKLEERMSSLKYAYLKEYKTSVSIEPFLDYDPLKLIQEVEPFVTESIWIGKMNYIPRNHVPKRFKHFYSSVRDNYKVEHLWKIYNELQQYPKIRIKDSIENKLRPKGYNISKK